MDFIKTAQVSLNLSFENIPSTLKDCIITLFCFPFYNLNGFLFAGDPFEDFPKNINTHSVKGIVTVSTFYCLPMIFFSTTFCAVFLLVSC